MEWERIRKRPEDYVGANLQDYEELCQDVLPGRRRGRCSTVCPAAASTSPMRRSTAMCWPAAATSSRCAGSAATTAFAISAMRALRAQTNRFANVLAQRGIAKGDRVFSLLGRSAGALHRRARHAEERQRLLAVVLGVRAGADQGAHDDRRCQGAGHHRSVLPAQGRALAQRAREPGACLPDRMFGQSAAGHDRSGRGAGASVGFVRDRADESRRHGSAALHQRHHRQAEGRRARARSRRRASHHRPARARSASRRYLLVHRRSRDG